MSTYAEDRWQEVAERAIAQGQSENEFLLSCHVANRAAALRAYRRAAGYLADVEEETGARAAIITACAHRLIPQLNYPQAEGGYECEKCGMLFVPYVEPEPNLLRRAFASQLRTEVVPVESIDIANFNKALQEEAQKPHPAGTLHTVAARTGRLACRESNFLHRTQLRTDDVPAESTADPEEAFSGRGRS